MSAEKKVSLLGEESDDIIEREVVWIMQLVKDTRDRFEIRSGQSDA